MSKPGPALAFYLTHVDDVAALDELQAPPDGVTAEDWSKFRRVVGLANEEVADFLDACRTRITVALRDAVVPIGQGASRTRLPETWDAWRDFGVPPAESKKALGCFGAAFTVHDTEGAMLVGYLRSKVRDTGLQEAVKAPAPTEGQLGSFTSDTAIVFQARVTPDTDIEQLVSACADKFAAAGESLKRYLARPPGG
jgi:hypothetical protein